MSEMTYLQAISDGLRQEMRRDKRVFVIGEDVGVYGGAFKVTLGFQEEFGPWRVIDAPLSETAIVGGCTGAAIMGMRPVAEMQFADFISCAWDHLVTVAAKQRWRAGTPVPITVRLPSGGGFSGGPFHSQNPESSFAHIPGLKVICPATPEDAKGLLATAIQDPNPCLYFEHKHLYRRIKADVPDERYETPFGKARVHREGSDLSVITWGAMVYTAEEAAQQLDSDGVSVEILDLRTLLPWDKQAVLESARKTSKVLVLHEDTHTGGFGAEIAATIAQIGGAPTDQAATASEQAAAGEPAQAEAPPEPATQQAADASMAAASEGVGDVAPSSVGSESEVPADASANGKSFVSPVVARIASEHGVDPGQVTGTGRGGRVTKKDILDFIEHGAPAAAPEPAAAPPAPAPAPAAAPAAQAPAAPSPPQPAATAGAGEQLEPMTAMRRGIAEHMRRSLDTAAHVTSAI